MSIDKLTPAIFVSASLLFANGATAKEEMPLYPSAIPGAIDAPDREAIRDPKEKYLFLMDTSRPTLTVYLPASTASPTPAVVIFPGGGYRGVSIVKEGYEVAEQFNKMGVAAIVVKYRMPSDVHMRNRTTGPLQDAQQALATVRRNAKQWRIDTERVGVIGFSAGGHLAATASVYFDKPVTDQVMSSSPGQASISVRPNFSILLYPVISMSDELAHQGSRENLLGATASSELKDRYSIERNIRSDVPPMLLIHAADDKAVPVGNTLRLFDALLAKNVSAEMHIYPRGGHGFGLHNATTDDQWIERVHNWLISQGILKAAPPRP